MRAANALFVLALGACTLAAGCSPGGTGPQRRPPSDEQLFLFGGADSRAELAETSPAAMRAALQRLTDGGSGPDVASAYGNHWIADPGWNAAVEASGEPEDGDLLVAEGYRYRTNLVDPESGVTIFAYAKTPPPAGLGATDGRVLVHGRLKGYARKGSGVIVLSDASFDAVAPRP